MVGNKLDVAVFLSTPSARRATLQPQQGQRGKPISIHALREEGDSSGLISSKWMCDFYPRPPRGGRHFSPLDSLLVVFDFYPRPPRGGRQSSGASASGTTIFLSTPSARRATKCSAQEGTCQMGFLSTPSARRATYRLHRSCRVRFDFYPRPPRGGRPDGIAKNSSLLDFYPRPPRGGRQKLFVLVLI